ncbi:MAG: hypothetical protein GY754_02540 [bacterium]|nr:hypothetical protein [bacterium]
MNSDTKLDWRYALPGLIIAYLAATMLSGFFILSLVINGVLPGRSKLYFLIFWIFIGAGALVTFIRFAFPGKIESHSSFSRGKRFALLTFIGLIFLYCLLVIQGGSCNPLAVFAPSLPMSFNGNSTGLKETQVVPTLDTPIIKGKNVIWCSSFLLAWKEAQEKVIGEPLQIKDADAVTARLNKAKNPSSHMPDNSYYAAAGWSDKNIIKTIHNKMRDMFPNRPPPRFEGIADNSFLMYSYLQAKINFTIPYFHNSYPLVFTDSNGKKAIIRSFGIRKEDDYAYYNLRKQAAVLYSKHNESYEPEEFIIDLCRDSRPNRLIIARVKPEESLAAALKMVKEKIKSGNEEEFGPNDILLVPDIFWHIKHHFAEIEGKSFLNAALADQRIDIALQEIQFRLDKSGADLLSEAKVMMMPIPSHYQFDSPFLIYMEKRGAENPFFVMWIDNAELLQKW